MCYFKLISRTQYIHRVRVWAGVNIKKFMPSKNGEKMSEHGLEFGMEWLHEEIDTIQNSRGLKIPMKGLELKGWCPGWIPSQWLSLLL